jgi:DNA excision repair protein ERCC-4
MPSIQLVTATLPSGDYCLGDALGVERKTSADSTDASDSAALIATAAHQLCDPLDIPYVRPGYRPAGWRRRALYILQGLPSIGPRRARALLERFGSVEAIVTADVSALAEVAGIGEGLARSIREALGGEKETQAY